MIHKCSGLPSKSWLCAYLKRYQDQRFTFELAEESRWWHLCGNHGFSKDAPITVSGVYVGLMKRSQDWPAWFSSGPMTLFLRFRKAIFRQGSVFARSPMARSNYEFKRDEIEFGLSEIRGLGIAERLRSMVPRLGHTPGRINCSKGTSETGFPSNKEPAPPPRGPDLCDDHDERGGCL